MLSEALRLWAWGVPLALGMPLLAWLVFLRTENGGWIDVAWAYSLGGLAMLFAVLGPGDPDRRLLTALLGGLWGLRLGTYLAWRVDHDLAEDGRYRQLRQDWGGNIRIKFLGFFLLQGLLNLVLCLPFLFAALDPRPGIPLATWMGGALVLLGTTGESLADAQLRAFKATPAACGQVCRHGLWALSRHPNYFFEWLVWLGFASAGLGGPCAVLGFLAPAIILHFLTRITGIPATEAQTLRSKGEAYRVYQREVSPFIPWFPRRSKP